ncbi:uncharacterized protein A4U43_C02F22830 [Asparagus officinalis]|uniref:Uncharacterized protein n=1 Tax=Asparagus officinalis TaxID=4686 RepID=A0A5P1FKI0_ASPOF|nr:uncharacterized protein A4U43_C02F22830 [Asparagus officinalis]
MGSIFNETAHAGNNTSSTFNNCSSTSSTKTSTKATSNGAWQGDNPLDYALPLLILQICIVVVLTRSLAYLLKPLRQPRVIAEIIGGILLGPSALGRSKKFLDTVFPTSSLTVLDTIANIGLLFFLFLVGLELDLRAIRRTGKRALAIALAGISVPFVLGIGTSVVLRSTVNKGVRQGPFLVFMGVALSITAFPVPWLRIISRAQVLPPPTLAASLCLLLPSMMWLLGYFSPSPSPSQRSGSLLVSLWVLLTGAAFVAGVAIFLRPILAMRLARRSPEGEHVKEVYICATLTTVLAAGFITDTIGIHALFGAFVVGIVVPKDGPFAGVLIEKVEDLIAGLLLPLYFVSSGLKTNVATISGAKSWGLLVLVIANACLGKIAGTVIVALMVKVPMRESLALGFLMNTKGLVELIVLNIGKDRKVLNDETFAILVLMALVTTFITTPAVMGIYKPARRSASYKHRTIERSDTESELRPPQRNGLPFWNKKSRDGDQMTVAFQAYQQLSSVSVRPATAISDLNTIHEDILASAQEKRVALILVPFHKLQQVDGSLESLGSTYQHVNQRVLRHAPCSVAILVDRGFGGIAQAAPGDVSYTVIVLFFGGPDDREALAYGLRMAEHPGIALTVLRFLPAVEGKGKSPEFEAGSSSSVVPDENATDEASISKLQAAKKDSIKFEEKVYEGRAQLVSTIKGVSKSCNIFLVGRRTPILPLVDRTDCEELGPVGSYLASSEFSTTASVLVIQRYDPKGDPSKFAEEVSEIHDVPDTPLSSIVPESDKSIP